MQDSKRDTGINNRLLDSVGEGKGRNRNADVENKLGSTLREGEGGTD